MSGQQNVAFAQDLDLGLKSPGPTTIPPLTFKVKECSKASQGMENSITESQFASEGPIFCSAWPVDNGPDTLDRS